MLEAMEVTNSRLNNSNVSSTGTVRENYLMFQELLVVRAMSLAKKYVL